MSENKSISEMLKERGQELALDLCRIATSFADSPSILTLDVLLKRVEREENELRNALSNQGEMPEEKDKAVLWLLASNLQHDREELVKKARGILEPLREHAQTTSSRDILRILAAYFDDKMFLSDLQVDWVQIGLGISKVIESVRNMPNYKNTLDDEVNGIRLIYEDAIGCFATGHYAASIVLSGRSLEQVLALLYVKQFNEDPGNKGIDALYNKISKSLQFDEAGGSLLASPELVTYLNSQRCTFVHRRTKVQVPTQDQARSVIHLVRDIILKAFG